MIWKNWFNDIPIKVQIYLKGDEKMKLYLLFVSYPHEGGYVHGVYSTKEEAERYMNDDNYVLSPSCAYIEEIKVDEFMRIDI